MAVSRELEIGKAAEHFVCCDLIMQGYTAFLSDQGLPYDVVVDYSGKLIRVQVKGTRQFKKYGKSKECYRFGIRHGKGNFRKISAKEVDYLAFVAVDDKKVAYLPIEHVKQKDGTMAGCVEFKSREFDYGKRKQFGKFFEDYGVFNPKEVPNGFA